MAKKAISIIIKNDVVKWCKTIYVKDEDGIETARININANGRILIYSARRITIPEDIVETKEFWMPEDRENKTHYYFSFDCKN